jgi:hypothetical protein
LTRVKNTTGIGLRFEIDSSDVFSAKCESILYDFAENGNMAPEQVKEVVTNEKTVRPPFNEKVIKKDAF